LEDKEAQTITGVTIDHLVSTTILLAVILIFTSLTSQTIQSAITYQQHRNLATKCTSILDSMLASPGSPSYWGSNSSVPTAFGLQDPESSQNRLSPFSLMRLRPSSGQIVYYPKTSSYYSNLTTGLGDSLLVPLTEIMNYSTVSELLGTNGTNGFRLTLTPTITVTISQTQPNPLQLAVNARGFGSPFSNGIVKYCLITIDIQGNYPVYFLNHGSAYLDSLGSVLLNFSSIDGGSKSFVLIAYAYLSGLVGMGYYKHVTYYENCLVPFVSDIEKGEVILAHSHDVDGSSSPVTLTYNATFLSTTNDFTLAEMPLGNSTGVINSGEGNPYGVLTLSKDTSGILVAAYKRGSAESGVVLLPFGIGTLAFPMSFGGDPTGKAWVSTDMRQVVVSFVGHQTMLSLWGLEGNEVIGR
jgi:hypothetical protein